MAKSSSTPAPAAPPLTMDQRHGADIGRVPLAERTGFRLSAGAHKVDGTAVDVAPEAAGAPFGFHEIAAGRHNVDGRQWTLMPGEVITIPSHLRPTRYG